MNPEDFFEIKLITKRGKAQLSAFPQNSNKLIFLFCYILLPLQ